MVRIMISVGALAVVQGAIEDVDSVQVPAKLSWPWSRRRGHTTYAPVPASTTYEPWTQTTTYEPWEPSTTYEPGPSWPWSRRRGHTTYAPAPASTTYEPWAPSTPTYEPAYASTTTYEPAPASTTKYEPGPSPTPEPWEPTTTYEPWPTTQAPPSQREHWAVIVAGSNGYNNYRHQADACHAYQIMRNKGIAADHIILMAYDDVANNYENPFPGKLFNKPTADGVEGVDVYEGCNIDYKGQDVNIANFVGVLTGTASGKSLKSTSQDNVFINFVDHGGPGLICFPGFVEEMHKVQLQQTLQTMSDTNMFHKLTFYLETCESGSMFEGLNIPNVYAVSAANPTESSFGAYCGGSARVNGQNIDSCLGDLFSINWMEDADLDWGGESLNDAWRIAHNNTVGSDVMQWGDTSFTLDRSSEFIGNLNIKSLSSVATPEIPKNPISVRQIDLNRLYDKYARATTSSERLQAGEQMQRELASQMMVDLVHERILGLLFPDDEAKQEEMRTSKAKPENMDCELRVHRAFHAHAVGQFRPNSAFALQFHQIVVNVCAEFSSANGATSMLESVVEAACSSRVLV